MGLIPDTSRPDDVLRAFPRGWKSGDERALLAALSEPLRRYAAGRAFTELALATAAPLASLPAEITHELARMGLRAEPGSSLRFYPDTGRPRGGDSNSEPARTSRRVLLIGLDGADWDIIDPLMQQGRMPHMRRLVDQGARARLKAISPVLSPILWTSIVTGVGPDRHGIVDFLATSVTTGQQIPVTSNMRRVKALWNILSENGRSSGVVAWWATWPAEEVAGFIVSDRVAYQLFGYPAGREQLRRRTFPEPLSLVIQPFVVSPAQIPGAKVRDLLPLEDSGSAGSSEELDNKIRTIIASSRTYLGIGMDLMRAYDPDLKAIYFEGTDTIAHSFMRYRPPAMPGVTEPEVETYGGVVDRYYEYQDQVLGELMSLADDRTVVIICSDHGFRTGSNRPLSDPRIEMGGAADWHRKFGILTMTGPGIKKGITMRDASVMDIAPTVLALMGLPVAADMAGAPLIEAFDPSPDIQTIASYESGSSRPGAESVEPVGSALDEEIVAKLTALGYVSAQEGTNALNNTGVTLLERGRYSEAADVFSRAVGQAPGFFQAWLNLGRAQMLMKEHERAIRSIRKALRIDSSQAEAHNLLGNIHMTRGELEEAERSFRKGLELEPNATNSRNSLGLLYEKMGKDDLALSEYRKVVAIDPDYAEGHNNIGLIHRKRGEPAKAIELLERAIRADPDFAGSYNNMGLAYQDMGRLKEAREAFERGLAVDRDNAVLLNNLGTLDLVEENLAAAKSRFEEAIAADPDYPSAYNNLGAVLGMMGDQDGSLTQYLKAAGLDPAYTDARFNLARVYLAQNKVDEGITMLERVLAIDPRYAKASLQLGIVLAQRGNLEAALKRVSQAARQMPNSAEPHNLLADIYVGLGRPREAREELARSLAIDPAQPKIREALEKMRP